MNENEILQLDRDYLWHPYASTTDPDPVYAVRSASGWEIKLSNGQRLLDGMSSWWSAIHGYHHPALDKAVHNQLQQMSHVMFGGLTHEPAVRLGQKLVELTPSSLQRVFLCDSGSVAVEVALKMALQYWQARKQPDRCRFMALQHGYHGDTYHAMSVCDPVTGMHQLFAHSLPQQIFAPAPQARFGEACSKRELATLHRLFGEHHHELAAVIVEPIAQGAGGMRFYSADYLTHLRALCDEYDVLLIADEIATGFGRTGRLFACEYAQISPDLMCLGKALTGGYMTSAAVLATTEVANQVSAHGTGLPGCLMHGPTFMANPLACAVANASIELLLNSTWQQRVARIEEALCTGLTPCAQLDAVAEVRVLGAIGVVELKKPVEMRTIQAELVKRGVWVRPFGRLVYLMPPFIMPPNVVLQMCGALNEVVAGIN